MTAVQASSELRPSLSSPSTCHTCSSHCSSEGHSAALPINGASRKCSTSLTSSSSSTDPSSPSSSALLSSTDDERRLMTRAINEGDLDEVRRLLSIGCDPNAVFVKLSMLQYATLHEDVEMMQVRSQMRNIFVHRFSLFFFLLFFI